MRRYPGTAPSTLMKLWREAVLLKRGHRCILSDGTCEGPVECHHYVRRGVPHLRYDWRNGVPLCKYHHGKASLKIVDQQIRRRLGSDADAIEQIEWMLFPNFLSHIGKSREEFFRDIHDELAAIVKGE